MMALEYTAALMCLFNLSPISAVVPQWLQLLVGGWASTAWCCPQFLLLFLPLVSCALVVGCYTYGRVDKPLNGDLRMTNDGAV